MQKITNRKALVLAALAPALAALAGCGLNQPEVHLGTSLDAAKKAQQAQMEQDDTAVTARETVRAIEGHMQGNRDMGGSSLGGSKGSSQPN
ncbi:MAG: hypothetical protein ACKOXK_11505 [Chakrabartia sp.]